MSGSETVLASDGSRWLLTVGSKRDSITFAAGQRNEIRSAERAVLAWFRDWNSTRCDGVVEECSEVFLWIQDVLGGRC